MTAKKTTGDIKVFEYPAREVHIEVINKTQSPVIMDKGTEAVLMVGTSICYNLPIDPKGSGFVDPFRIYAQLMGVKDEKNYAEQIQERLEYDLGLDKGALRTTYVQREKLLESVWRTEKFKVKLKKTTKELSSATLKLDLKKPADFMRYLISLASHLCANSYDKRNSNTYYLAVIRDLAIDRERELTFNEKRSNVIVKLNGLYRAGKVQGLYTIFNLLKLKSRYKASRPNLSSNSHVADFFNELMEAADQNTYLKVLADVVDVTPEKLDAYLSFFKAKEGGMFREVNGRYTYEDEMIGSVEDVINWLSKDENVKLKAAVKQL